MISRLSLKAGNTSEGVMPQVFYSPSGQMNEMMKRYSEEAEADNIWISINASEIHDEVIGSKFFEVIETAFSVIMKNCIESTRPRNRWIHFICRIMQDKIFVKIEYSCENNELAGFKSSIEKIRNILDSADGFLDISQEAERAVMRIALPIKI